MPATLRLAGVASEDFPAQPIPLQSIMIHGKHEDDDASALIRRWDTRDAVRCRLCEVCTRIDAPDGQSMCVQPIMGHAPVEEGVDLVVFAR
jgi:hypothetical protein